MKFLCHSLRKVSKHYKISKSTLQRWVAKARGDKKTKQKRIRKTKDILQSVKQCIETLLEKNPFSRIQDVCKEIAKTCELKYSISKVRRLVSKLGYIKKKAFNTVDYSPNPEEALSFCNSYLIFSDSELICIDEAGIFVGDHGRRGYARRGKRLHVSSCKTLRKSKFTLVMAINRCSSLRSIGSKLSETRLLELC